MIKSDFHIHTTYCDGADSAKNVVLTAIGKGLTTIGFSSHSASANDDIYGMKKAQVSGYRAGILELKEKYSSKIDILLGLELDSLGEPFGEYDYIIGSVHNLIKDGVMYEVDCSKEGFEKMLAAYGTVENLLKSYFDAVCDMAKDKKPTIIGHFDLIAKFNEGNKYFDETSDYYLDLAEKAIIAIKPYCNLFEINTGAMSRGHRSVPYPSAGILRLFKKHNIDVIVNSDCHLAKNIAYAFDGAERLLLNCGYTHRTEITSDGIIKVKI